MACALVSCGGCERALHDVEALSQCPIADIVDPAVRGECDMVYRCPGLEECLIPRSAGSWRE